MSNLAPTQKTHLTNILRKTGKNQKQLTALIRNSGLTRPRELRTMVMRELGLSYTDADALVYAVERSGGQAEKKQREALDALYKGARAPLRTIHEAVIREVKRLGQFEMVPGKGCVSFQRKKQFILLGPAGSKRVELGLNVKDLPPSTRLMEQPRGSECNYLVQLSDPSQVNAEVIAWIKFAYEAAG